MELRGLVRFGEELKVWVGFFKWNSGLSKWGCGGVGDGLDEKSRIDPRIFGFRTLSPT